MGENRRCSPMKIMAATRAGMRVAAISSDGPRWLDGLVGSGPPRGPKLLAQPGGRPSLTCTVCLVAPRQIWSARVWSGFIDLITSRSCASLATGFPSAATMMSPPSR